MKPYELYSTEDFIQDEDFRDWVRGRNNQESFWLSFLQRYPQQKEAFQQAERFVRAATVAPERISEGEIRREAALFIEKAGPFGSHLHPTSTRFEPQKGLLRLPYTIRWGMTAAALFVAVVGVGWYVSVNADTPVPVVFHRPDGSTTQLVETTNLTRQPLRVVLHDGSEVILSPQSQLRYPSQFAGNARIVYLTGEGVFSVKRRNQPFMVHTGEMVTKVLGTRFVVRAFDKDRKFTVQVLSGKVSVYTPKPERTPDSKEVNGLILNANQAAIFEKSDGNLTKTLVAKPFLIEQQSSQRQFVYDEVPLPTILRELEKGYAIPIQFDEQSFEGCKITAVLTSESLYEKLDILCKAASASYEITDGQIVVSRQGYK